MTNPSQSIGGQARHRASADKSELKLKSNIRDRGSVLRNPALILIVVSILSENKFVYSIP
jgi:hypothetical protein